jgi:hypothetical protein
MTASAGRDQETGIKTAQTGAGQETDPLKSRTGNEIEIECERIEESGCEIETVSIEAAERSGRVVEVQTGTDLLEVGLAYEQNMVVHLIDYAGSRYSIR